MIHSPYNSPNKKIKIYTKPKKISLNKVFPNMNKKKLLKKK